MAKELEFHEAAEQYPLMPEPELVRLVDDMKDNGFDPRFKIAMYDGKILDGRNRYIASNRAGIKAEFVPIPKSVDPQLYVQRANEHRRHLTTEWLHAKRQERIERVSEAVSNGKSTREIAKGERVSQSQVIRDLESAGKTTSKQSEPYGSPEKKPDSPLTKAGPVICETCKRKGTKNGYPDCAMCATAREQAKIAKKVEKELEKDEEPPEWNVEESIKEKNNELEAWCRELMKFVDTMPADPWLNDLDRRDGAVQKIKNACDTIRSAKCHCKCPKCKGDGCAKCYHTGRVTKYAYDQMGAK
jgi:transposase